MNKQMNAQLKIRTDTSDNWTTSNKALLVGEFGYDSTTGSLKIGPGNWNDLPAIKGVDSAQFVQVMGDQTIVDKKQFKGELLIGQNADFAKNMRWVSDTNTSTLMWGDEE